MINFIKKSILTFLFVAVGSVEASTLTFENVTKILNDRIYIETKQKLSNVSDDIKIKITGIPKENYTFEGTKEPKLEILSQNSNFMPNSFKRIIIKDDKNNTIKAFPVNVQTFVYKDVLVANTTIPFNSEIKAENVSIEKREISKYINRTYSNFKEGLVASRNFQKGSIILSDYAKAKSAITKNSMVEIIFLSDKGLKITLRGKALKDGAIGDTIPVRSDKYNKVYNAKVSSSNEVMVRI